MRNLDVAVAVAALGLGACSSAHTSADGGADGGPARDGRPPEDAPAGADATPDSPSGDARGPDARGGCVDREAPPLPRWELGDRKPRGDANCQAVQVPDGRVFTIGTACSFSRTHNYSSVEVYDPASDTWERHETSPAPVGQHTATLLPSGLVLYTIGRGGTSEETVFREAYLIDPETETISPTGFLNEGRMFHRGVMLADGRYLVSGGDAEREPLEPPDAIASTEIYDPETERWTLVAPMNEARYAHRLTRLPSGRVLATGGAGEDGTHLASAEIYDPEADRWDRVDLMAERRAWHVAEVLPSGRVLVAGGDTADLDATASVEIYDPETEGWRPGPTLPRPAARAAATVLASGDVLVTGGYDASGGSVDTFTPLGMAALWREGHCDWWSLSPLNRPRFGHSLLELGDGRALVVAGEALMDPPYEAEITTGPLP